MRGRFSDENKRCRSFSSSRQPINESPISPIENSAGQKIDSDSDNEFVSYSSIINQAEGVMQIRWNVAGLQAWLQTSAR